MRTFLFPALCAGLSLCLAAACSSNSGSGSGASGAGGQQHPATCPSDLAEAPGSAFCAGDLSSIDCSLVTPADREQVCGVAVASPTSALGALRRRRGVRRQRPARSELLPALRLPHRGHLGAP